jgi:hypothetical protein
MTEPIVFISHLRVKEGKLEDLLAASRPRATLLHAAKPRTVVFLGYLSEDRTQVSFVHIFPDADAFDLHNEGAAARTSAAYQLIEPDGWEVYGSPSAAALAMLEREAAQAGVTLTVQPGFIAGFLRLASGV